MKSGPASSGVQQQLTRSCASGDRRSSPFTDSKTPFPCGEPVFAIQEILKYSPETGEFRWERGHGNKVKAGDLAGCMSSDGYWVIGIAGKVYKAHRLAWLYMHGVWPSIFVDHIDGNPLNNAILNLRDVDPSQNQKNRIGRGYSFDPRRGKFQAKISVDGKSISLGSFSSEVEARRAYLEAHLKHHGEYSVVHRVAS